jgi:hypothetical protein
LPSWAHCCSVSAMMQTVLELVINDREDSCSSSVFFGK